MGKWLNLTALLKSQVIKFAILNGVSNIKDIRDTFNIYANGGDLAHKKSGEELGETQYLKLDDAANYKAYEDATNYFLNLGFSPKLASEYAIDKVHNNMTFDAGMLPEINVTAQAWGDGDNTSRMENYLKARLNVREAATLAQQIDFNLNIRNATDKWGKGIGLGMTALAALPVASGAMAGMNALRASYPIATGLWDAYWAGDGIVRNLFGDSGVKKTYNLIKEGDTWGALKSGAGDALDLLGVADLFSLGKKILTPTYRAAHAYHTIRPWNYDDPFNRGKLFVTSMLTGLEPNVNINPQWFVEHLKYGALSALHELYGRDEAWRMYLGLPTRRGYYIPNKDGSFSYNLQKIMKDAKINNKWNVMGLGLDATDVLLATGHKGRDVITGAAGYLGQNDLLYKHVIPNQNIELSIRRIGDDWDLHPFRKQNSLSSSINKSIMTTANRMYSSIYDKLQKTHDVLFGQHHSSNTPLRIWYDYLGGKQLRNLRFEGLSDAVAANIDKLNFLQNFEMGPILGGKPFKMITDVPMTKNLSPTDVFDIYTIGFPNNVQLPTDITNWQLQALPEVQVTFPTSNLHSTGGPLYPFSFEMNPFLKTPVVRYDEGGQTYAVKKGDTFSLIALNVGVSVLDLLKLNPTITNVNRIREGLRITIPSYMFSEIFNTPVQTSLISPKQITSTPVKEVKQPVVQQPVVLQPVIQKTTGLKTAGPLDLQELAVRQAYTESRLRPDIVNSKGAYGLFQIMQPALDDYNRVNKTNYTLEDMKDADNNIKVRNWYMDYLSNLGFINKGDIQSDSVGMYKVLASFNAGAGNVKNALTKAKADGKDIYDSWDWVSYLWDEPREYADFILRGIETKGTNKNDSVYKAVSKAKSGTANKIRSSVKL